MPDPISSRLTSPVRRPGSDAEAPPGEGQGRARRLWSVLPVCAGFAVFGVIVWLAYQDVSLGPPIGEPPLIKATAEPIKLPPEQAEQTTLAAEQGTIGQLWSDAEPADQPERLLPPPEEPLSPPLIQQRGATQQAQEQAPGQSPDEAGADAPAIGIVGDDAASDASVAALSAEAPAEAPDGAPLPSPSDESLREAEAALDRLLAEVTGLPDDAATPGATPAGAGADEGSVEAAPEPAESPPSEQTTIAATTSESPVPALPPEKPASAASAATPATSTEVRPAGALTAAPPSDAERPDRSTETAALTRGGAPIAAPPVVPGGEFRIQLAAVRGEVDARRAWDLFMADLGPVLTEIEPIFERAETANGVFYRVQIGPFGSQETAESLCEDLKQRNASCFVIRR